MRPLLFSFLVLIVGCTSSENPPADGAGTEGRASAASVPLHGEERDGGLPEGTLRDAEVLYGTWELVGQQGYPTDHDPPESRITFRENGMVEMILTATMGDQRETLRESVPYEVRGGALVLAGETLPATLEGNRLMVQGAAHLPEARDIYERRSDAAPEAAP